MKKYQSLGELLIDYRKINKISQADFAANLNVDVRTISRWEKNITLVKPEKEDAIVQETLLPHQIIRNLNSLAAIPTYYDFKIRKYSLNEISTKLPNASWFKEQIHLKSDRIRPIIFENDIEYILKYMRFKEDSSNIVNRHIIKEAIKLLPELNLIITDDSGFYAGHSIVFPLNPDSYEKLKKREITENQLSVKDLANYNNQTKPIFHTYDLTVDCNDNGYYLLAAIFRFFKNLQKDTYISSSYTTRNDNIEINRDVGMKIIWEDKEMQAKLGLEIPPRFVEGNYIDFLSD
jgi:transcriptional regulator with XRE-family HTH domain